MARRTAAQKKIEKENIHPGEKAGNASRRILPHRVLRTGRNCFFVVLCSLIFNSHR
jgi:hypothetical protein